MNSKLVILNLLNDYTNQGKNIIRGLTITDYNFKKMNSETIIEILDAVTKERYSYMTIGWQTDK